MNELELLLRGGVVGGGGAGFPLWKKLSSPADQLLINGAECEPLLKSDQYLMVRYAAQLAEAASRLAAVIHAREAVICLNCLLPCSGRQIRVLPSLSLLYSTHEF